MANWIHLSDADLRTLAKIPRFKKLDSVRVALERLNGEQADYIKEKIEDAKLQHRDGELEVDDDAIVSIGGDPGAYVMAWLWIGDRDEDEAAA